MAHKKHQVIQYGMLIALIGMGISIAIIPRTSLSSTRLDLEYSLPIISYQNSSSGRTITDPQLLLRADKQHSLGEYTPNDLVEISLSPGNYLRIEAAAALDRMIRAAHSEGVTLRVLSAYRSFATQMRLFENYARIYGREVANTFSALPGHSEHQLGTTIDFGNNDQTDLNSSFENTQQSHWLTENARHYGFVLSYPKGREEETGYIYEPWHYRYIGVEHAYAFHAADITLNFYLNTLHQ